MANNNQNQTHENDNGFDELKCMNICLIVYQIQHLVGHLLYLFTWDEHHISNQSTQYPLDLVYFKLQPNNNGIFQKLKVNSDEPSLLISLV
jgi:hypothetical protein